MLFMLVAKHTPEDCPGGLIRPDKDFLKRVVEHVESSGVAVTEIYLDAPGHVYFLIVEARDNEALNNVLEPFRFIGKVKIHPVLKLSDAITWTKKIGIQR